MEKLTRQQKRKLQTSAMPTEHQINVQFIVFLQYGHKNFAYDVNGEDVYVIRDKKYIKVQIEEIDCCL
jgi:hypothetical protein